MKYITASLLVLLPAVVLGKKCTNPTDAPSTDAAMDTTTPYMEETTTEYFPPPTAWPLGKFALGMAGDSCPDFYNFKKGRWYQDTEDYRNMNSWPSSSPGLPGPMKYDGLTRHFCTKTQKKGAYDFDAGDYCIHALGNCPKNFESGYIFWDDENSNNANKRVGKLPSGKYGADTNQTFCCRNDGSVDAGISLPVTQPFYMYRYTSSRCQKVREMTVIEEVIQFDDEDTNNQNEVGGAHPYLSGGAPDHKIHLCLYMPEGGAVEVQEF